MSSHTLSLIFVIAVVASIVIQSFVFLGLYLLVRKTLGKLTSATEGLSGKAMPIVTEVRAVVQDLAPKVKIISAHVADITSAVREQTQHVNSSVDDVVDRTHAQAVRVDDMVSAVLGSLAHAGATVQSGVSKPVRQASGVVRGVRVGLETLFSRSRPSGRVPVDGRTQPQPQAEVIAEKLGNL